LKSIIGCIIDMTLDPDIMDLYLIMVSFPVLDTMFLKIMTLDVPPVFGEETAGFAEHPAEPSEVVVVFRCPSYFVGKNGCF